MLVRAILANYSLHNAAENYPATSGALFPLFTTYFFSH